MSRTPANNPGVAAKLEQERRMRDSLSGHKTGLPKKLLDLFNPLPPVETVPPVHRRKPKLPYSGVGQYVDLFAAPGDPEYEPQVPEMPAEPRRFRNPEMPAQARVEKPTKAEKAVRIREHKSQKAAAKIEESLKEWDPAKDSTIEGDPFKTLFVGRLSFDATEKKLQREFGEFGPIKSIRLIHDKDSGKPRGYAFIEFEHKNDMKNAYKMADGRKVEGKRVTVDVERGRTVPNWKPRRLGGGKGGETRLPREPKTLMRRLKKGLPAVPAPPAAGAAPPPAERPPERERVPMQAPVQAPPPERFPVSDGRDRERDRAPPRSSDRDRREPDRDRDRAAVRERDRAREPEKVREPVRERDRENGRDHGRERERDRERDRGSERGSDRKRERDDRERDRAGGSERGTDRKRERERDDDRSAKRSRDEADQSSRGHSSGRRERDY